LVAVEYAEGYSMIRSRLTRPHPCYRSDLKRRIINVSLTHYGLPGNRPTPQPW